MKIIWKGALSFGLINIPIKLYAATESHALGFTLLHEKCHTPIKYHRWCPHCKKEISWEQTVKGLAVDGEYLILTQEMIKELRPHSTDSISIVEFVTIDAIDMVYMNHHYIVTPDKKSEHAFLLFLKALESLDKAAIGRFVMRDKEYTCMITAQDSYLLLTTLHYAYEIRDVADLMVKSSKKVDPKELKLAQELIQKLSVKKFDITQFKDTFAQQLKKLLKQSRSQKGIKKTKPMKKRVERKKPSIVDALKASLEEKRIVARA
jgi:DNA end-binding protein Ku